MKKRFSDVVKALGGETRYRGYNSKENVPDRTMFVHNLDEIAAQALSIEFTGVVLPFKVVFQ